MTTGDRQPLIAFLLGKPARPDTIFPELFGRLRQCHVDVTIHLPKGDAPVSDQLFAATLIVQRGLGAPELDGLRGVEDAGIRCCNGVAATIAVTDRLLTLQRLARAAVPTPSTALVATWPEVLAARRAEPLVVKGLDGSIGRGSNVLGVDGSELSHDEPFPGPYLVQQFIANDGRDRKLYVAGPQVRGLLGNAPEGGPARNARDSFAVDPELAALARQVGHALELEIYGVDVVFGPTGPSVVDVNPFPGFRGVPNVAQLVADYLLTIIDIDFRS